MIVKEIRDLRTTKKENGNFRPICLSLNQVKSLSLEIRRNQIVNPKQKTGILGNCWNVPDLVEVGIGYIQELVKMNHAKDQRNDKQVMCVIHMNVTWRTRFVQRNAEVVRIQLSKIAWAKDLTAKKKLSKLMKYAIHLIVCLAITSPPRRNFGISTYAQFHTWIY